MTSCSRSGVFTPVVIMVLAVFAILGVTYSFTGASSYGQSAQSIYTLKASLLAHAAMEEAQMIVYDKVNRPAKHPLYPEWKTDLLTKVAEEVKAKESGGRDPGTGPIKFRGADANGWISLLSAGMVEKVNTLATDLGGEAEISECRVKFYGFRKIPYNEKGDVYNKESYYRNDLLDKDVPDYVPNDFIGYYTIRATAKSRNQTKSFAVTHDIKIVNVAPIGHDFGVFQMQEIKDQSHSDTDLNMGGAWRLYPRGWARAYMRGPYTVETEGLKTGEGGYGPADKDDPKQVVSNSFLKFVNANGDVEGWDGWHQIPTPRAGVSKRAWLVIGKDQVRPKTAQTSFGATIVGEITNNIPVVSAVGAGATALGADPGLYIAENDVWYTGLKDHTGREFSLMGEPRGDPTKGFGFSGFRGEQFRLDKDKPSEKIDNVAFWPVLELEKGGASTGPKPYKYVGQYMDKPPSSTDSSWYIAPEAFLKIKCNVVRFKHPGVNWTDLFRLRNPFNFSYNLSPNDTSSTPGGVATQLYALHWEPPRTRGVWDSIMDGVLALTPAFFFVNPAFLIFNIDPRNFFSGSVPGSSEDFKDVRPKSLPTNFKGVWPRAATRMYKNLAKMRSIAEATKAGGNTFAKVMLDGVIWSSKLELEAPLQYTGKGIIGAEPPDKEAHEAVLTGPVIPVRDRIQEAQARDGAGAGDTWQDENRRWTTENFLTVVYQGHKDKVMEANQMILMKLKPVGSKPLYDASIFSTHSVKPEVGQTVTLYGNLICNVINKKKVHDTSTFLLDYNDRVLPRRNNGAGPVAERPDTAVKNYTGGDWHNCAVSPRVSGYIER